MKAELTLITDEMTGNTALTKALNDNFNALNDMAHNREMAIFNRFNEVVAKIEDSERNILAAIKNIRKPNKDLLKDNEN